MMLEVRNRVGVEQESEEEESGGKVDAIDFSEVPMLVCEWVARARWNMGLLRLTIKPWKYSLVFEVHSFRGFLV